MVSLLNIQTIRKAVIALSVTCATAVIAMYPSQSALAQADSERLALTRLRLDNGASNQLDWLDAQRTAFASQQGLIAAQLAVLQSQATLYKVLGGGTQEP